MKIALIAMELVTVVEVTTMVGTDVALVSAAVTWVPAAVDWVSATVDMIFNFCLIL